MNIEYKILIIFLFSLFTALTVTAIVRKVATRYGIGEMPAARRVHTTFMPHMGGLGIYSGFIGGILLSAVILPESFTALLHAYGALLLASFIVLLLGVYDDLKGLNATRKFGGQFIAVTILILSGCVIKAVELPLGDELQLGVWAVPITYLWLIGVSNAVNLLDGLDGLAAGVGMIAMLTLTVVAWNGHNWTLLVLLLALLAGLAGFLKFNYHPATIFMGDTGSLFLGLMLAALSLKTFENTPGHISSLAPLIILAIPIGDTSVAVFRRLNKGRHPFKPDKDHLHHRLIYLGLSHRQAVHIIYLASLLYAITAYLIIVHSSFLGGLSLLFALILSAFGLKRIGYLEARKVTTFYGDDSLIKVKRELAPLSWSRIMHKLLLIFTDALMVNLALLAAWWVRFESGWFHVQNMITVDQFLMTPLTVLLTLSWLLLFALNNLYLQRWDVSRFDHVRQYSKVILFGIALLFLLTLDPAKMFTEGRLTLLIYGLFMIAFVNGGRILIITLEKQFAVLEYSPHKTLIVGTSEKGRKLLKDIARNPHLLYQPLGYVTREPRQKPFYGLPYLGGYDDIPRIIREQGVEEVIIAINERSRDEVLNIVARAMHMNVAFKILPQIYDVVSGHKTAEVIGHPLIRLFPESMHLWQWMLKRLFDIFLALLLMVLLLPLALFIIAMQLFSGIHPPFTIVETMGKHGRPFGRFEFRTERKKSGEPWIGRILRKTRFYKFPALVNILMGKMSFVGPRPMDLEFARLLEEKVKFYRRRFQVRPGLTGWAQVRFRYEEALKNQREQLKQDLFYLENISLSFDFRIILRSVFIFLLQRERP